MKPLRKIPFRTPQGFLTVLAAALVASAVHGQDSRVVSPETFTIRENLAWGVQLLLWPETLENAVIMYGYNLDSACAVIDDDQLLARVQPSDNENESGQSYTVRFFQETTAACDTTSNTSTLEVDDEIATMFAEMVARAVEANNESLYGDDSDLLFSVGRLPGIEEGLEMWTFCGAGERLCELAHGI